MKSLLNQTNSLIRSSSRKMCQEHILTPEVPARLSTRGAQSMRGSMGCINSNYRWIPAFAGMTGLVSE